MFKIADMEYLSTNEIAKELGATYRTVNDAINALGIPFLRNPSDRREQGYPRSRIEDIRQYLLQPEHR